MVRQVMSLLREIRIKRQMTLEELSRKSGVSRVSINRYELGERCPNIRIAKQLADALGCTLDELVGSANEGKIGVEKVV